MTRDVTGRQFATQAIHAGETPDPATGAHNPPIYQTTTYAFASLAEKQAVLSGEREGFVYTRRGNPTTRMFEQKLAALEGAEDSVLAASGMGTISTTLLSLLSNGGHLNAPGAPDPGAGGARRILVQRDELARPGVDAGGIDPHAALGEQLGHVGVAQPIPQIPPHREGDDVGREAIPREGRRAPGGKAPSAVSATVDLGPLPVETVLPHRICAATRAHHLAVNHRSPHRPSLTTTGVSTPLHSAREARAHDDRSPCHVNGLTTAPRGYCPRTHPANTRHGVWRSRR